MIRVFRAEQGFPTTPNVPTYAPLPIPESGAFDDDTICISINKTWARRVADVLSYLDQPDVWDGSENEVWDARDEAKKIMGVLRSEEGNCVPEEPVDAITDIRINAQNNIEYTKDGVIWNVITPRIVPNKNTLFAAEVTAGGRAELPSVITNPMAAEQNSFYALRSKGPNGTPYISGAVRAFSPTNSHAEGDLWLNGGSVSGPGAIQLRREGGVDSIGFFGHAPESRKTIVGEIPLGPTYELAQAMLQYGLIGGAIVGIDPSETNESQYLMDVTMGEDCHLEIWRFDGDTPVIWRSIDLRACLARYAPGWSFDSIFTLGPTANEQWDVTNGTMTLNGLEAQDVNPGGGSSYISTSHAIWEFEERYALTSIELLYEVASGASWSGMSIKIIVDYGAEEAVEISPTPGEEGLLIWNAADGLRDVLAVSVHADYNWDAIFDVNPNVRILGVRFGGKGDQLTEVS